MSYSFSNKSLSELRTCEHGIIVTMSRVIKHVDCTILQGYRGEGEQNRMFMEGRSELRYPMSKHNKTPSRAIDVIPYPVIWPDKKKRPDTFVADMNRFARFAGFVQATAISLGYELRWGGDWDRDWDLTDNIFNDFPHFELVD